MASGAVLKSLARIGPAEVLALSLAVGLGGLVVWDPTSATGAVAGVVVVCAVLGLIRGASLWRGAVTLAVSGYIILGKGFAYVGLPIGETPLYVAELLLLLCAALVPHRQVLGRYLKDPAARLLLAWMAFGLILTIPSVRKYRLVALRDAATWYYAAFAYVGYAFAAREEDVRRLLRVLGLAFCVQLVYSVAYSAGVLRGLSPMAPGSTVPLLKFLQLTSAVQLGGGFLFALFVARHFGWPLGLRWVLSLPPLILLLAFQVRAAYVGFALACGYLMAAMRAKRVLLAALVVGLLTMIAATTDLKVQLGSPSRAVSAVRVLEEFQTMLPGSHGTRYEYRGSETSASTVEWRLEYWRWVLELNARSLRTLVAGQGFGPDLTPPFGSREHWIAKRSRPNRNPHNIAVTIFGRMGLVGLGLWIMFHGLAFWRMWRWSTGRTRSLDAWQTDVATFLTSYIALMLGTAFFAVLLESPFMAVSYYFLVGLTLRLASAHPNHQAEPGTRLEADWPTAG